jgi:transposase
MLSRGTNVTVSKGIMDTVTEFTEVKGARKCRRRTVDEKRQIVEETLSVGVRWRRLHAVTK